ncbi:hypothetical protein AMTRI_Chr02g222440 [Amborella trichopoda]|uniref:F-box domain-containing protein n=1 Tax=Amborella trichopoda TaxID=13333 RepID=U5D9B5_AMBTC|nr:uncharacterized protein LOC18445320 [Amborella trichopoda]ERN16988.1 hypothetical protein AMTR_s00057p00209380 [Amborella trichopoda]|eukprot:XP_006855521.1 uncharacterized protein LOC18445320 [Amborella trichopoda]
MDSANESSIKVDDLDMDTLVHCTSSLNLQDLANMAVTCRRFRDVAYSDHVWNRRFRERWPVECTHSYNSKFGGIREAYLARLTSLQQFKFADPRIHLLDAGPTPSNHILLDKNNAFISQGSVIYKLKFGSDQRQRLADHKARITCLRLFSLGNISFFRSEESNNDKILVTSSCDHTIRLWGKDRSMRSLRGHDGPVTILSDKLLGDLGGLVLASGGEDGTVRLWSLSSKGRHGRNALRATLHGHEHSVRLLSVAGHKSSLLVSASKDSKLRVWDSSVSTASGSTACVGTARVSGAPIGMKCNEALCYVGAGSSLNVIDLRTMKAVASVASDAHKLQALEVLPTKHLICTGGSDKTAKLWDIRKLHEKAEAMAVLDGHLGPVTCVHMDSYKVVTGGSEDSFVKIWETDTGLETCTLPCGIEEDETETRSVLATMAVDKLRIVTSSCRGMVSLTLLRDFSDCKEPLSSKVENFEGVEDGISKFWDSSFQSHGE